jgi:bifunctional non-homologous end joining protein LigD
MPLTWGQVIRGLDTQRFTLRSAPAQLARARPWEGYGEAARCLVQAVERAAAGSRAAKKKSDASK